MTDKNKPSPLRVKSLLLGDAGVGKTTLMCAASDPGFEFDPQRYVSTIGVDFKFKSVQHGKEEAKLMLWDTGHGRERFRTITRAYYRGADVILICFDISDRASFKNVERWAGEVRQYAPEGVTTVLLGTKADLREASGSSAKMPMVTFQEGVGKASAIGAFKYLEVSSKTKESLDDIFDDQLISKALELAQGRRQAKFDASTSTNVQKYSPAPGQGISCTLL
mmetsp:Transcript_34227/g.63469  ORF Transcript_34227/g.63469 Transcript_34227/m.63469 type:complete len:222 (-) Transcript_34227:206-871(-)